MAKTFSILIVEDDPITRQVLIRMLGKILPGVRLIATPRIGEARTHLDNEAFDLVMVDGQLEDGCGPELVEGADHASVPFLGVSGDFELLKQLQQAGCRETLAKPFDLSELIEAVALCLGAEEETDVHTVGKLAGYPGNGSGVLPAGSYTRPAA